MTREPTRAMIWSVLDCFINPLPEETLRDMWDDAIKVVVAWWRCE